MSQLNSLIRAESLKPFLSKGFRTKKAGEAKPQKFLDYERLPLGVFPLDYMFAGGIPFNVLTQFFGPPSGGKNTAAILAAKSLSGFCTECLTPALGCTCIGDPKISETFYCHIGEGRPDGYWADVLRYDADENMVLATPEYGEQAGDAIEAAIEHPNCGLIILDSLAGLDSRRSMTESYEKGLMAEAPRLIAKLVKRVNSRLLLEYKKGHRVAAIFLNQIRSVIGGSPYGPSETTAGGWGSKHGYRLSSRCSQLSVEKKEMGATSNLREVLKFSMSVMGSEAKQQILLLAGKAEYKLNVADTEELEAGRPIDAKAVMKYAKDLGMLKKVGARYVFGEHSFANQRDFLMLLQADPDMDALIKWQVINEAKRLHTESIGRNRVRRVNQCIGNAKSAGASKTTKRKKRTVIRRKPSTSAG